mmetsp:Transcript_7240/g.13733  ORF Transcript_7240/g.13733 Transcript_7240/m.13733 type:complete len:229 (+) Transcript_7240:1462-2148(+)
MRWFCSLAAPARRERCLWSVLCSCLYFSMFFFSFEHDSLSEEYSVFSFEMVLEASSSLSFAFDFSAANCFSVFLTSCSTAWSALKLFSLSASSVLIISSLSPGLPPPTSAKGPSPSAFSPAASSLQKASSRSSPSSLLCARSAAVWTSFFRSWLAATCDLSSANSCSSCCFSASVSLARDDKFFSSSDLKRFSFALTFISSISFSCTAVASFCFFFSTAANSFATGST